MLRKQLIALLFIYLLLPIYSIAGEAILSWDAPTTNTDGTPLTDLAGYKIYHGPSSGVYVSTIDVGNVLSYTVENLSEGVARYFVATAYDTSGNESGYSNEVSKTIKLLHKEQKIINLRFRAR